MTKMIWMDPPKPSVGRPVKFTREAKTLKENPLRWAKLGRYSPDTASKIKRGKMAAFKPAGAYEAVNRDVVNTKADLYVRYVGVGEL